LQNSSSGTIIGKDVIFEATIAAVLKKRKIHIIGVLLIITALLPFAVIPLLPKYEQCKHEYYTSQSVKEDDSIKANTICFVDGLDTHSGAITALATLAIAAFTWAILVINDQQLRHAHKVERAYLIGGGPVVINNNTPDIVCMDIVNRGKTLGFIKEVRLGVCAEEDFPKTGTVSENIKNKKLKLIALVFNKEGDYSLDDVATPYMNYPVYRAPFLHKLNGEQIGQVFYGKIDYTDIFGDSHYSTFKLKLIPRDKGGSMPLEGCYSDWT